MTPAARRTLLALLLVYGLATLVHFIHNAEYLREYPGMPASWTRAGVYSVWLGMTAIGLAGWLLLARGHRKMGWTLLAVYALLGLDSLGHYVLAPLSAHTAGMNGTILFEVTAAGLVLLEVARQAASHVLGRGAHG